MPFITLRDLPGFDIIPGFHAQLYHSEELTFGKVSIAAGAELPTHDHHHEQFTLVLEGQIEFTIDGVTELLEPGMVAHMPPYASHSARAVTDCIVFDCFRPVREDLKARS